MSGPHLHNRIAYLTPKITPFSEIDTERQCPPSKRDVEFIEATMKREIDNTSAGTIGALTAVAASSPFKAPTTASAISIATPSWIDFQIAFVNK